LFCSDRQVKTYRLRSFRQNHQRVTYLFKICPACHRWEKLHSSRMVKPIRSRSVRKQSVSRCKKSQANKKHQSSCSSGQTLQASTSNQQQHTDSKQRSNKLQKFTLNDVTKLRQMLNNV